MSFKNLHHLIEEELNIKNFNKNNEFFSEISNHQTCIHRKVLNDIFLIERKESGENIEFFLYNFSLNLIQAEKIPSKIMKLKFLNEYDNEIIFTKKENKKIFFQILLDDSSSQNSFVLFNEKRIFGKKNNFYI